MLTTLLFALVVAQAQPVAQPKVESAPVQLWRKFKKGEAFTYEIKSHLMEETQEIGSPTFMPDEIDINYAATEEVSDLKADGMAVMHYRRPTMTIIEGQTADADPKTTTEKSNVDFLVTLSQVNEFIGVKDLTKKGDKKKPSKDSLLLAAGAHRRQVASVGAFIQELGRLSLFVGSIDSSLEFSPKLPLRPVKPGDSWKKTVSYQPQKLGTSGEKMAVQRLDYVFTYGGVVESGGKKVHRIVGKLDLDTDAAPFYNAMFEENPADGPIKSIALKLKSEIDFDLDLDTCRTLRAKSSSTGSVVIALKEVSESVMEIRLTGKTSLATKAK